MANFSMDWWWGQQPDGTIGGITQEEQAAQDAQEPTGEDMNPFAPATTTPGSPDSVSWWDATSDPNNTGLVGPVDPQDFGNQNTGFDNLSNALDPSVVWEGDAQNQGGSSSGMFPGEQDTQGGISDGAEFGIDVLSTIGKTIAQGLASGSPIGALWTMVTNAGENWRNSREGQSIISRLSSMGGSPGTSGGLMAEDSPWYINPDQSQRNEWSGFPYETWHQGESSNDPFQWTDYGNMVTDVVGDSGNNPVGGIMDPDSANFVSPVPPSEQGAYQGQGSNGSITGNGQFGYATRITRGGSAAGGGLPNKQPLPTPSEDDE